MMSFVRPKRNVKPKDKWRRAPLFALSLILAFTLLQPVEVYGLINLNAITAPKQPAALPASKVDIASTQAIADPSTKTVASEKIKEDKTRVRELTDLRTTNSKTFLNRDGSKSMEYSLVPKHYEKSGKLVDLNPTTKNSGFKSSKLVVEDTDTSLLSPSTGPQAFDVKTGDISATLKPFNDGIEVAYQDKRFSIVPEFARNVKPKKETFNGQEVITYKNAWPNVDVTYELVGNMLKETLILKNKSAQSSFKYKVHGTDKVVAHPTIAGALAVEGIDPEMFYIAPLSINVNGKGIISSQQASWGVDKQSLTLNLDASWYKSLSSADFPVAVDPSFVNNVGGTYGQFIGYKSDGYSCGSNICDPQAGTVYDNGWKHWRTMFRIPFDQLQGKRLMGAYVKLIKKQRNYYTGGNEQRYFNVSWGSGFHFNGYHPPSASGYGLVSTGEWLWVGDTVNWMIQNGQWGGWMMLNGENVPYNTYKQFEPTELQMHVDYDTPPTMAAPSEPADKQVTINTQPTLRVNPAGDGDGEAVKYYFRVATSSDAETGAVINSGWIDSTQWTIPEGILQDGTTYYWHVYTKSGPDTQTNPNWVRSFKLDLRTGKDSTQAYDTVGPVGVDLATGNVTTSSSTHTMNALGGSIGLGLNYDSPAKTSKGLIGEYWNVGSGHPFGTLPSGNPVMTRNDQDINFSFSTGSPGGGVNTDWFYVRWKGYFVAPVTGSYQFGASQDDAVNIKVGSNEFSGCYGAAPCYNGAPVTLQAGQAVPITVQYEEATGDGYFRMYVKGAVPEQIVSREWLQTEVKASVAQYGLAGRYYTHDGNKTFPADNGDPMRLMMARNDSKLTFNWGTGGPANGLQSDNFMVKWTGYITTPASGNYTFGADTDDGVRVKVNNGPLGASNIVLDSWQYLPSRVWGNATGLTAGQQIPITVEYYEENGPAHFNLLVRDPQGVEQEVPVKWLTPKASALPDGWQLGVDVDGNVGYERLRVAGNNVILEDSTRATHEYAWTGSGYKPPVNEDGNLTKNADNTFTFIDSDGRTYVFDAEGKLTSLTTPTDDRQPANLKYKYSGDPSRLIKIADGVTVAANDTNLDTATRYATLHYKNVNEEGNCNVPGGYETAPDGMLCAFRTSDGDVTKLYYKSGQLSRIEKPGIELSDYEYDTLGRIVSTRDTTANDAIAYGARADDSNDTNKPLRTKMSYDNIGRASVVVAPEPTVGAARLNHTFEYLGGGTGYVGATQMHIVGAPEQNGFSKRVEYDSLLRTVREIDVANLALVTEWDSVKDLQLSSTDATGLKSTTIYDGDDRPTESYGPAPAAWFGADRKPSASYAAQVPKMTTGYDEGMTGPAVSWFNYRARPDTSTAPGTGGALVGVPRLFATGVNSTSGILSADIANPAITYDGAYTGVGFRATGKLYLPAGNYWINAQNTEGIRVWVDDQLILDSWQDGGNRGITGGSFTVGAGEIKRFRVDTYRKNGSTGQFALSIKQDYGFDWTNNWSQWLKPDYGLATSQTAYDAQLGNVTTQTTYSKPEYGTVDKTILDPTGLNYQSTATYEAPGTGFLRQTSKTLPGGGTVNYHHYGANEMRANPCISGSPQVSQAGRAKGKTEADPDGAGPQTGRSSETIYNASGEVVATRYNSDPWTCVTYDARGRTTQTAVPALGQHQPARIITNNYAPNNNPLVTTTTDSTGTVTVENDLLGRTTRYVDVHSNITTSSYNTQGLLLSRSSPLGSEEFVYDQYDRLVDQKLDGTVYAHITYDQLGRTDNVTYPAAGQQKVQYSRDVLGRQSGLSYTVAASATPGPNLVSNSSLEQSTGTPLTPIGWTNGAWGNNTPLLTYESTGRTGSKSVKAEITSHNDGDAKWYFAPVSVTGNTNYTFTDYYKSNAWSSVVAQYTHQDNTTSWTYLGGKDVSSTWSQASFGFTTPATATKVTILHLMDRVGWLQIDDVELYQTNTSSSTTISDSVTRSVSGDVVSGNENGAAKSYTYDNAGRLTSATIGSNSYAYEFSAPAAGQCTQGSANPNAHKNGNRTKFTANGASTTYCYDYADRLISSSDPNLSNIEYDAHGNMTRIGATLRPVYDASDRNRGMEQYDTSGNGHAVYYVRDAQDRIVTRSKSLIQNWNWNWQSSAIYGFTGGGDTPDFVKDANGTIQEKYILLAGDVLMTIRPQQSGTSQKTYSLPNVHDDIFATTNALGQVISTHVTGPFGEEVANRPAPGNTVAGTSFAYVGQHEKITETDFAVDLTQMGARVYVPSLGRFLQVDTVEGGTDNSYAYANDPVNQFDLDGRAIPLLIIAAVYVGGLAWSAYDAHKNPTPTNMGMMALSAVPGGGSAKLGIKAVGLAKAAAPFLAKKATQASAKIKPVLKSGATKAITYVNKKMPWTNKNNFARINTNRIAFGPAQAKYGNGKPGSRIPYHFEINWSKKKVFLENVKTKKTIFCKGRNCW